MSTTRYQRAIWSWVTRSPRRSDSNPVLRRAAQMRPWSRDAGARTRQRTQASTAGGLPTLEGAASADGRAGCVRDVAEDHVVDRDAVVEAALFVESPPRPRR